MRGIGMRARRSLLGAVCAALLSLGGASLAQGAAPEPDFVLFPHLLEQLPPQPDLQDPCGVGVDTSGSFYVSNYYRHTIDIFSPAFSFMTQVFNIDPLDGPCGLALDTTGRLYVNNYHRNVEKFIPSPFPVIKTTSYSPAGIVDSSHPTGVAVNTATNNVYVNVRTHLTAYGPTGTPLLDGSEPLRIGVGSLGDGYGLAVSRFSATNGRIYVPDHADETVKVYDPLIDIDDPVQTITGPPGGFGSLRDSAVAVDRVTGEIYVADTLAYPQFTERPEAAIHVFGPTGTYKGRLKYNVVDSSPPGLAVDNSTGVKQGRVYVTSGNSIEASVYAYPPGSATSASQPASFSLAVSANGGGAGSVTSSLGGIDCSASCEEQIRSGAQVQLTATSKQGSFFGGWSGAGCSGTGPCVVEMSQARAVSAEFEALSGPPSQPTPGASASGDPLAATSAIAQKGTLRVSVSGKLAPKRLPRRGAAPISVSVGGEISTTDASLPPQLKTLRIELNREGRLDSTGLPTCVYDRIQPGSSSRALSICHPSLVGKGSFTASITLAGQEPYPTKGQLLVFNGIRGGKPVLYGHIYSPAPFATSFVIVFRVQKLGAGTYGTALDAPLPEAMDAWGRLTSLEMTLSRRYSYRGKHHSYISAGCPAPKGFSGAVFPLARTSFSFDGGKKLSSVLSSSCKARG
jgi:DNA-binding beta-propeller fold protein YncE